MSSATRPSSSARLAANRANAQKSTGPRTAEGKQASASNSRKHGLTSRDLVIAPHEQPEFDTIQDRFFVELEPAGILELTVFQQVVAAAWNLRRIRRMEAAAFDGYNGLELLDSLARHTTRFERSYARALAELRTLQTERTQRQSVVPNGDVLTVPTLVPLLQVAGRMRAFTGHHPMVTGPCSSRTDLAKRTQSAATAIPVRAPGVPA